MPDRYIPISEDEQKFGALLERVLTDEKFAQELRERPVVALQQAGYHLTERDKKVIESQRIAEDTELAQGVTDVTELAFPLTKPVVSILTKGTKPVVRVVTKGTQPAVSVAVNTVIAVRESTAPPLIVDKGEAEKERGST
jgi:hypothetical protein